jgi:hypothetical protein
MVVPMGVALKIKMSGRPGTQFQDERNRHESIYEAGLLLCFVMTLHFQIRNWKINN